jgi:hypothetical protein
MYAAHLAAGLAVKGCVPRAPTGALALSQNIRHTASLTTGRIHS